MIRSFHGIDRSIEGSRPHGGIRFVFGHVNSVDQEASFAHAHRIFDRSIVNAHILIDSFSGMRERLLLIYLQTQTHTLQIGLYTHTHTHKHTDTTHYRSGHSAICHSSED